MRRVRCVYAGGRPLPGVEVLLLRECRLARAVVAVGGVAFREEAEEFLRQRLGVEGVEVGPCREVVINA
jgi:hypothetical protein